VTVNLDRLRKQMDSWKTDRVRLAAWDAANAVLDAPLVWWCGLEHHACPDGSHSYAVDGQDVARRRCERHHPGEGCGWVVLVPVEGEGN
jgi:hypothetical protein